MEELPAESVAAPHAPVQGEGQPVPLERADTGSSRGEGQGCGACPQEARPYTVCDPTFPKLRRNPAFSLAH